ncbi:MAG: nucleotidyltransferase domain-containing protein [Desulfuromusa sp.]|jgi:predicted nucleotidyltransferase|nr:nucleotidyltransferase domain-containing protein [Desulfuromusa sp.]
MGKDKIKAILIDLLRDKADFALLFGSWAKDEARITRESDVDCGVFFHPAIVADKSYFDIAEHFEYTLGRKLDIVCLNTADIIIASQIVATGEVFFAHSKTQLDAYRAQVMSRYLDFKQSRKIIEDNILVRPNYVQ